ncbi:MAG: NADH-quinone oxidoreductase subunit C, partial [Actinopolymorphaceae bacterium]
MSTDWYADTRDLLATALDVEVGFDEGFDPPTLDVPPERWVDALRVLRDEAGCTFFDWLSAVDELDQGFAIVCHVARLGAHRGPSASAGPDKSADKSAPPGAGEPAVAHMLVRTRIPRATPALESATGVYAGAGWHERETHEMFGIDFTGHPGLSPLLLPDEFEGHPLRKEFVLAARVAKAWPGAKEPGESDHDTGRAPSRRRMAPPGVPAAEAWGPRPPGSP